jgi:hypothetical protein
MPPHPSLSWKEIVDYSFIGEFDTLQHSRADIRDQSWTHTACCEATVKFFKLCCAREEIMRLDIEMRQLHVSICNEAIHYEQVISQLSSSDPPLAAELRQVWKLQSAVNRLHIQCLDAIQKSSAFLCTRSALNKQMEGERAMNAKEIVNGIGSDGNLEDEDTHNELEKLADFVLSIMD